MNKRGFLFSVLTVLLLTSLIFMSSSYVKKSNELNEIKERSFLADRLAYIEDDVITDFMNIVNISISNISRNPHTDEITLQFDSLGILPHTTIENDLSNYEDFIEGNFSNLINANITLTNLNKNFTFRPYNSTIIIGEDDDLNIYTQDLAKLKAISIEVDIDQDISNDQCASSQPSGDTVITVNVNYQGENRLSCSSNLKNDGNCNANNFNVRRQGNEVDERIDFWWCDHNGSDGVFRLETSSGLNAEIRDLNLTYTLVNDLTQLESHGSINLKSKTGNINKENGILVLGKEGYYRIPDN